MLSDGTTSQGETGSFRPTSILAVCGLTTVSISLSLGPESPVTVFAPCA